MGRPKKKIDVNDDLGQISRSYIKEAASVINDDLGQGSKQEKQDLRSLLTPFAEWIYGNKEVAQAVIDKYFKQTKS